MFESNRRAWLHVRCSLLAIASLASLTHGIEAKAQDNTSKSEANSGEKSTNREIVVTARRREESLQDTPIAASALNADTLGYAEKIYARPRNWFVQLSAEF